MLQRVGALTDSLAITAMKNADPVVRLHTLKALAEQKDTSKLLLPLIVQMLDDKNPHVQRATLELMGRYPSMATIAQIIGFRRKADSTDTHVIYTSRLMLRNMLRNKELMVQTASRKWSTEEAAIIASVLAGVENAASGEFLYHYLNDNGLTMSSLPNAFKHIIRFVPAQKINEVIKTGIHKGTLYPHLEYRIYSSLNDGLVRRGAQPTAQLAKWGKDMAISILKHSVNDTAAHDAGAIQFAVSLAGNYQLATLYYPLQKIFADTVNHIDLRTNSLRSMMKINPENNVKITQAILDDTATSTEFKRQMVAVMTDFMSKPLTDLLAGVKNAPPDLQWWIIMALASSPYGNDLLFEKVSSGELLPRNIAEPKIEERILLHATSAQQNKYRALTAVLGDVDVEKQAVINDRITKFERRPSAYSPQNGQLVFLKNCAPCHAIKDQGGHIGPQLDGVGKWGVTSLSEKILDPNRNVSENFRSYTVKLKDGKTLTGLYRRDEGQALIFVDMLGKEFTVSKKDIKEKIPSKYTLMPDQFRNTIPADEFYSLLAFLMTQKTD